MVGSLTHQNQIACYPFTVRRSRTRRFIGLIGGIPKWRLLGSGQMSAAVEPCCRNEFSCCAFPSEALPESSRTACHQGACPVTSLITTTTRAMTKRICTNAPATWNENPRSQKIRRMTAIVQSIVAIRSHAKEFLDLIDPKITVE